jgi:hypothetical protein
MTRDEFVGELMACARRFWTAMWSASAQIEGRCDGCRQDQRSRPPRHLTAIIGADEKTTTVGDHTRHHLVVSVCQSPVLNCEVA